MSLEAITWAYRTSVGSAPRKAVLLVLANYADEKGSSYPGYPRIAAMTELSESTVRKAITELEELGVVTRESQTRSNGSTNNNRYRLHLGWVPGDGTPLPGDGTPWVPGDGTPPNTKQITQEKDTNPHVAPRGATSEWTRSRRKDRPTADTDEGQERTGHIPADGPAVAPAPRVQKRLSAFELANRFEDQASRTTDAPAAARITQAGALGANIKKWISEGLKLEDIAKAMDIFFVAPTQRLQPGQSLWLAFVNHIVPLHEQATRTSTHDIDYINRPTKENVEMTEDEWRASVAKRMNP